MIVSKHDILHMISKHVELQDGNKDKEREWNKRKEKKGKMIFPNPEVQQYISDVDFFIYSWVKLRNTSQFSLVGDLRGTAPFRDESLSYIPA